MQTVDKDELIQLAQEFGLPCIERENSITVIGLVQFLEFNIEETKQCQLTQTY